MTGADAATMRLDKWLWCARFFKSRALATRFCAETGLRINGAKDDEVPIEGGMSRNPLVSRAQATPFKPVKEVVDFWVKANTSKAPGATKVDGTVTTTTYAAGEGGAVTEFVVDSVGGHGWPGTRSRRAAANEPIASFKGAERVWEFFRDKSRAAAPSAPAKPVSGGGAGR